MARIFPRHQRRLLRLPVTPAFAFVVANYTKSFVWLSIPRRALRALGAGRLLASDSLPCWRTARRKNMARHRLPGATGARRGARPNRQLVAPHRHGSATINYTRRLSLTLTSSRLFMKYAAATSGHQFPLVRPRASRPPLIAT